MKTTKLFMGLYPMTLNQAKEALQSLENCSKFSYFGEDSATKNERRELTKFISNF